MGVSLNLRMLILLGSPVKLKKQVQKNVIDGSHMCNQRKNIWLVNALKCSERI